jgi:LysM repeat protein
MRRNRRFSWIVLLTLGLMLAALPASAQQTPDEPGETYRIQEGDTLLSIATQFDKPLRCLQLANDLPTSILTLGTLDRLFIPEDCTPYTEARGVASAASEIVTLEVQPEAQTYVVERGDRLADIAESFDVPLVCLVQANAIRNPDLIYIGQTLIIPADCAGSGGGGSASEADNRVCKFDRNASREAAGGLYVVQAGDAMDLIACDFGVALQCLIDANPQVANPARLKVGETLVIDFSCPPWTDPTLPPGQP